MDLKAGSRNHNQLGNKTLLNRLLALPGGTQMSNRKIRPSPTACRCSQIDSTARLGVNSTAGSTTCQAWRTNSLNSRRHLSTFTWLNDGSDSEQGLEMGELVIGEFGQVDLGLDGPLVWTGKLCRRLIPLT